MIDIDERINEIQEKLDGYLFNIKNKNYKLEEKISFYKQKLASKSN